MRKKRALVSLSEWRLAQPTGSGYRVISAIYAAGNALKKLARNCASQTSVENKDEDY
jgi:hypothetical protein